MQSMRPSARATRSSCAHPVRHVLGLHVARVRARRVQDGAARAVERPDPVRRQRHRPSLERRRVVRVELQQAQPAAAQAEHVDAVVPRPQRDRLDGDVQAGDVAAARQDSDASCGHGPPFSMWVSCDDSRREAPHGCAGQAAPAIRPWGLCYDRRSDRRRAPARRRFAAFHTRAGSSVVEHRTFNAVVVGSIPTRLTSDSSRRRQAGEQRITHDGSCSSTCRFSCASPRCLFGLQPSARPSQRLVRPPRDGEAAQPGQPAFPRRRVEALAPASGERIVDVGFGGGYALDLIRERVAPAAAGRCRHLERS